MAKSENTIPYGYCQCGCGGLTSLATMTNGKCGRIKGQPQRFIKGHTNRGKIGTETSGWKGGRSMRDGYITVYKPEHPRADHHGHVYEHIIIAERALGRSLRAPEEVHHWGAKTDNTKLVICQDRGYHLMLHVRKRRRLAGFNMDQDFKSYQ